MHPTLTREQAPPDSERSTQQTVERMAQHIRESGGDPVVIGAAHQCLRSAGGPGASALARCKAVFYWIKAHVKFRTDDALIQQLFGEQDQLELLISPPVLLRAARPEGDCDDFTMLACTLLNALGVPNRIVTVKADQPDPSRWSHVYCCANVDGRRLILDCSHGDFPGWEVPQYYEKRYWDAGSGQGLSTEAGSVPAPSQFSCQAGLAGVGLHGFTRRGGPFRRGLGDDDSLDSLPIGSTPIDTTIPNIDTTIPVATGTGTPLFTNSAGVPLTAGQASPSSYPSTTPTPQGLTQLLSSGFATLQLALSPTGSVLVQNPNGSYSIQTPNAAGLTASSMSSLLWIGGAVVGVVVLASVLKK